MTSYEGLDLDRSSTVERAADALRRALFAGDIAAGTPLREVALAEQLGVARSTIREALGLLVADGLAQRVVNRGVVVTEHDPAQVHDVISARRVLESAGVRAWRQAGEGAQRTVRAALAAYEVQAHDEEAVPMISAAHLRFHVSLVSLTGSSRLVSVAEGLAAEIRLALATVDRVRRNAADQVRAHRWLVDQLDSADPDDAAGLILAHLRDAEDSIVSALSP